MKAIPIICAVITALAAGCATKYDMRIPVRGSQGTCLTASPGHYDNQMKYTNTCTQPISYVVCHRRDDPDCDRDEGASGTVLSSGETFSVTLMEYGTKSVVACPRGTIRYQNSSAGALVYTEAYCNGEAPPAPNATAEFVTALSQLAVTAATMSASNRSQQTQSFQTPGAPLRRAAPPTAANPNLIAQQPSITRNDGSQTAPSNSPARCPSVGNSNASIIASVSCECQQRQRATVKITPHGASCVGTFDNQFLFGCSVSTGSIASCTQR